MVVELLPNIFSHKPHHLVRQSHHPERHSAVFPSLGVTYYFLLVPVLSWSLISDIAVAVIAMLLLIMTFVYAWMVMRNFGRGLKDQSTST
jgi:hypothetical protein